MRKRVLIVTCEMLPLPGAEVRGGGLRVWGLGEGLKAHGHEVRYSLPREAVPPDFTLPDDLAELLHEPENLNEIILAAMPDVVIVEQWGLASYLDELRIPLAIDLHGPLSLENAFKQGGDFLADALTKIDALARADLLICPGEYQRQYFLTWFLMAGASPHDAPIALVPVALGKDLPERRPSSGLKFVFGGVTWPWIDPFPGLETLAKRVAAEPTAMLDLYVGAPIVDYRHPLYAINKDIYRDYGERLRGLERVNIHPFVPRDELLNIYTESSVAFDLYQRNVERQLAFTTRTVEYLWCGLPVIYGDYGELAAPIREYDAGWVLDPTDKKALSRALDEIFTDPSLVANKSDNARKLAAERFTWEKATAPLAKFVAKPTRREKKTSLLAGFRDYFRKESVNQILEAKNEVAELNAELRRAATQHESERRERDKRIEQLSEELKKLILQHDLDLRKQADIHRQELNLKETDLRRQQEKLDREIAQRDKQLAETRAESKAELQQLREEIKLLNREKEKTRQEHEQEVKKVVERQESEVGQLRKKQAEEAVEAQRRLTREVERREDLDRTLNAEIKRLNVKLENFYEERDRRETKIGEEMTALRAEVKTLAPLVEERDKQLAELEATLGAVREKLENSAKELAVKLADNAGLIKERDALNEEVAGKLIDLERAIFDKERYIEEAEKRFADLQDKLAKQVHRLGIAESARRQAESDVEKSRQAAADRQAEADLLRGDLEKTRRQARDQESELNVLRKRDRLRERLLADYENESAARRKQRRAFRLRRWLWQLPTLAVLFSVNLIANGFMKIQEKRTGRKIFPGT